MPIPVYSWFLSHSCPDPAIDTASDPSYAVALEMKVTRYCPRTPGLALLGALLFAPLARAADPLALRNPQGEERGTDFFERQVRPLLVEYCYECHSHEAEKLRGNLHLDSRPGWQEGGDSGPAIIPGDPEGSLLVHAIRYDDEDLEMPPKQKLPQSAIDVLAKWIAIGAPDPRTTAPSSPFEASAKKGPPPIDLDEGRQFWSFQPVRKPALPKVRDADWPHNPIDRFILAKLEEKNLAPAPDADPHTLLRRLHIDLTGLPPIPAEVEDFAGVADPVFHLPSSISALEKVIDDLLQSSHFGERWGRHWLDLARYADSSGGGASKIFPDAWKYRDFVVRSYNDDLPFDRFVSRQLAGDLLTSVTPEERHENLVATGFLVLGPRNYINDDEAAFRMDGADEQLDSVSRVFLGMTVGCARCHDHKFDPVPMTDYYALAGIFTSTETYDPIPATTNFEWNDVADPRVDADGARLREYESAYARYRALAKQYSKARSDPGIDPAALKALDAERLEAQRAVPKKPPVLMGVVDAAAPADEKRRVRGNPHQPAEAIPRGFLRVTLREGTPPPAIAKHESGRRELAAWITSPDNPLTTRVYVNRVWAHLMGRGLVATLDNFGTTGEAPSHPDLLDWLASWFRENGQSTKKLVALIVTSHSYRLDAAPKNSALLRADPANNLFDRRTRRSLDAETIRDSILQVSGALDLESRSGKPFPASLKNEFDYVFDDDHRRSLYLPRFRNNLPELFETFDVANPATVVGRRDLTILSPQALYLMNNEFVRRESERAARALLALDLTVEEKIHRAYLATLGRAPTAEEAQLVADFLDKPHGRGENDYKHALERWTDFQHNLFACVDFRFLR